MSLPRRRLPRDYREGRALFLTWHLHGSVPQGLYPPPRKLNSGRAFVWMDRYLDTTRHGPLYLGNEAVARTLVTSIRRGAADLGHYDLHSFVVMANHVHLLVTPRISPSRLLRSLKGFTARQANRLLEQDRAALLAGGILRPLGTGRARAAEDHRLYREQPSEGRAGAAGRGLPLVECSREGRRGGG